MDAERPPAEVHPPILGLDHQLAHRAGSGHGPLEMHGVAIEPPSTQRQLIDAFLVGVQGVGGAPVKSVFQRVFDGGLGQPSCGILQAVPEWRRLDHGQELPGLEHVRVVVDSTAEFAGGHESVVQPPAGNVAHVAPSLAYLHGPAGRLRNIGQEIGRVRCVAIDILVDPVVVLPHRVAGGKEPSCDLGCFEDLDQRRTVALDRLAAIHLRGDRAGILQVHPGAWFARRLEEPLE